MVLALGSGGAVDANANLGPVVDQVLADEQPRGSRVAFPGNCPMGTRSGRWPDNQGTVRDLVDDAGPPVQRPAHSPFRQHTGSTTPGSPAAVDFVFGYTGTYTDPLTDLATPRRRPGRPDQPAVLARTRRGSPRDRIRTSTAGTRRRMGRTRGEWLAMALGHRRVPWSQPAQYGDRCWEYTKGNRRPCRDVGAVGTDAVTTSTGNLFHKTGRRASRIGRRLARAMSILVRTTGKTRG